MRLDRVTLRRPTGERGRLLARRPGGGLGTVPGRLALPISMADNWPSLSWYTGVMVWCITSPGEYVISAMRFPALSLIV
jgi:hypothetical protein